MKFLEDLRGLWRDSDTVVRIIIVVTFPLWVAAAWLAYVFDTDDVDQGPRV